MAIVKMKRLRLIALDGERDALFDRLQRLGCVELTATDSKLQDPVWSKLLRRDTVSLGDLKSQVTQVTHALAALKKYAPVKGGLLEIRPVLSEAAFLDADRFAKSLGIAKDINDSLSKLTRMHSAENRLINTQAGLRPWVKLTAPLDKLSTPHVRISLMVAPAAVPLENIQSALAEEASLAEVSLLHEDKDQKYLLLFAHNSVVDEVDKQLKPFGCNTVQFKEFTGTAEEHIRRLDDEIDASRKAREDLIAHIASYGDNRADLKHCFDRLQLELSREGSREHLLTDGTVIFLEGWASSLKLTALRKMLEEMNCAYEFSDPEQEDRVPTLLDNPKWMQPINMVTEMYSLPTYRGLDPNPYIFWFFIFFFGFMFADIAYGIIIFAVSSIIVSKYKPKGTMGYMFGLARYLGISTFLCGAATGGFFGDAITIFCANFLGMEGVVLPYLINPLADPMQVLIIAVIIGVFQLLFGQCLHIYMEARDGQPLEGILDVVPWWILFAGIGVAVLKGSFLVLWLGVAAIVLTQGRAKKGIVGKLFGGVAKLYDITSWLGDVLSYSRLMALMLATSVIASVMNILGSLPGNIVAFVIIFLIGHTFNIGINLIGTYVHAARLQYLEFFGKFYKEGGFAFRPLGYAGTKYVDVTTEEVE